MKKASKPKSGPPRSSGSVLGIGLAIVAGLAVLAVAGFALWRNNTSGPSANLTPEVNGAPRLKADKQTVDLGDIALGTTAQTSFEITNTGDQTLRFAKAPYVEVVEGC
jgi:hypothetical protein